MESVATVPNYHEIINLLQAGLTIQAREQIMALKEVTVTLQEENLALKQKLQLLESAGELPANMRFERGLYWLVTAPGEDDERAGPYCQACFDRDRKLAHLHRSQTPSGGWFCAVCRNSF